MTFVVDGIATRAAAIMVEAEGVPHFMADGFGGRVDGGGAGAVVAVEYQTDLIGGPVETAQVSSATPTTIDGRSVREQIAIGGQGHPDPPAAVAAA